MDRLVVVLNRATVVALSHVGDASVVVVVCIIRVQLNCFVKILDCTLEIALLFVGISTAIVSCFSIRVQVNCLVVVLNRVVIISLIVIGGAAVVVDDRQIFRRILACLDKRRASGDFGVQINRPALVQPFLQALSPP